MSTSVQIRLLTPTAKLPQYMTDGAAGMDLFADNPEPITLQSGTRAFIPSGVAIELPEGTECQVRPRSGLARKHGVTVLNAPGTIDADYRGEIGVTLINHGGFPLTIQRGDRIAQLVIAPVLRATFTVVADLTDTDRGSGGFGSTGF